MAEETKEETQEQISKTKKGGKKKFLLFLIIGVAIIALAGGVVAFLTSKKEGKEKGKELYHKDTIIYSMEPIVVNLFDPTGKRYLQVSLALELRSKKLKEEIKHNEPKIKDAIIMVLSSKTPEEVLQPGAKELIKNELLYKINSILGKKVVLNVYITQYIVE